MHVTDVMPTILALAGVQPLATIRGIATQRMNGLDCAAVLTHDAALDLPGTPPRIDGDARAQIQRVAALYNEQPRPVRVIAYTAAAVPGA